MAGSLEGPLAKWTRAKTKLACLHNEIREVWPPHEAWPVTPEPDRTGLEYRFYVGELPDIEPEWALAVGEILFDLRSALDHLAYQLHVRHFRGTVPKQVRLKGFKRPVQVEGHTQFPIYDSEAAWSSNLSRIATLSKRDQTALQRLQPYIRWNDKWYWHRWALSRLNAWHNWDKHRKLHLITASKDSAIITEPDPFRTAVHPVYGAVKSHGEVERWTFSQPPQNVPRHPGVYLHVALMEEGQPQHALTVVTLVILRDRVREVINRFAGRFPT